jgi:6-phosphogluconolactonase
MKLVEYADAEMMAIDLANVLAGRLKNSLLVDDRVTFIVPGGETPGPMFDNLCAADLEWARVDVILSDERWLPEVHVRSNSRMIKERLLTGRAAKAVFHSYYDEAMTPETVLPELEARLLPLLPAKMVLLGMGADMHTASLFPEGDNLLLALSETAPVVVPMRGTDIPEPRVTLSAKVLNEAMDKHLILTGTPKRNALEKAQGLPPEKAPIAAILENCTVHWAP